MDKHGEHTSGLDEHRWVRLDDPAVDPALIAAAANSFEPCPHNAGTAAQQWLLGVLAGEIPPLETWLCLTQHDELAGFVSLTPTSFTLSERDRPRLHVRRVGRMEPDPQCATMIVWIARDHRRRAGTGRTLFRVALARADINGDAGLIVEPHDADVREMWINTYGFWEFKPATGQLWFPIDTAPQGYP